MAGITTREWPVCSSGTVGGKLSWTNGVPVLPLGRAKGTLDPGTTWHQPRKHVLVALCQKEPTCLHVGISFRTRGKWRNFAYRKEKNYRELEKGEKNGDLAPVTPPEDPSMPGPSSVPAAPPGSAHEIQGEAKGGKKRKGEAAEDSSPLHDMCVWGLYDPAEFGLILDVTGHPFFLEIVGIAFVNPDTPETHGGKYFVNCLTLSEYANRKHNVCGGAQWTQLMNAKIICALNVLFLFPLYTRSSRSPLMGFPFQSTTKASPHFKERQRRKDSLLAGAGGQLAFPTLSLFAPQAQGGGFGMSLQPHPQPSLSGPGAPQQQQQAVASSFLSAPGVPRQQVGQVPMQQQQQQGSGMPLQQQHVQEQQAPVPPVEQQEWNEHKNLERMGELQQAKERFIEKQREEEEKEKERLRMLPAYRAMLEAFPEFVRPHLGGRGLRENEDGSCTSAWSPSNKQPEVGELIQIWYRCDGDHGGPGVRKQERARVEMRGIHDTTREGYSYIRWVNPLHIPTKTGSKIISDQSGGAWLPLHQMEWSKITGPEEVKLKRLLGTLGWGRPIGKAASSSSSSSSSCSSAV
uniref:Uncharacterized protein n=1 Tax=Chromera velia CCMP2878 TaxID=1169474 RepID=A0A0G4FKD0_9ALVE|eukprot:Cvel_17336.t1-p1 / transcript=Cvel_17336.t1 / gene=Cvel_17336 / organism=Chromera_velia_CCMP2878 / gene_product=hypothetical protein / transcript_product=hypothetical protein / location=Cvel_scaffold1377:21885-31017(+) / protein_length=573 / sequence_SO=supercontig / SO=protein_coding / is_pseudo=false